MDEDDEIAMTWAGIEALLRQAQMDLQRGDAPDPSEFAEASWQARDAILEWLRDGYRWTGKRAPETIWTIRRRLAWGIGLCQLLKIDEGETEGSMIPFPRHRRYHDVLKWLLIQAQRELWPDGVE